MYAVRCAAVTFGLGATGIETEAFLFEVFVVLERLVWTEGAVEALERPVDVLDALGFVIRVV